MVHVADIFEAIADAIPEALALSWGEERRSWAAFEDRAARLAQAMTAAGLGAGSPVVLYLHNSPAYLEAHFATLKMRGVPVNGNYRYVEDELLYLLDNSDAEAIVYDSSLAPRVAAVAGRAETLKLLIEVGGAAAPGAIPYESLMAGHAPMPRIARDPADRQLTYTGGTTGLPKGVMRSLGPYARGLMSIAAEALGAAPPTSPQAAADQARRLRDEGRAPVSIVGPPFMHSTGMAYGALVPLMSGGTVVMPPSRSFAPAELLSVVQSARGASLTIVGDVMARPLALELDRAAEAGMPYDVASLRTVYSAGMIWTAESKRALLRHAPQARLIDVVGSSEGHVGTSYATRDNVPDTGVFTPNPTTRVLTPDGRAVAPGSGEAGLLACAGGTVGTGYHKDPEKSARTYRVIDGVNYAIAGDWAAVDADGSIRFIGRDSSCINTGGEKVFAEEVENVIRRMPQVIDCIVVGVPDARWGQVVAAVVAARADALLIPEAVCDWVRASLAGYKVPRRVAVVPAAPRAPNGKADLAAALELFLQDAAAPQT